MIKIAYDNYDPNTILACRITQFHEVNRGGFMYMELSPQFFFPYVCVCVCDIDSYLSKENKEYQFIII